MGRKEKLSGRALFGLEIFMLSIPILVIELAKLTSMADSILLP
jgi:hypothetical protein